MTRPTWQQVRFTFGPWGWRQFRCRAKLKLYATLYCWLSRD